VCDLGSHSGDCDDYSLQGWGGHLTTFWMDVLHPSLGWTAIFGNIPLQHVKVTLLVINSDEAF
jgi:hypothetical protein